MIENLIQNTYLLSACINREIQWSETTLTLSDINSLFNGGVCGSFVTLEIWENWVHVHVHCRRSHARLKLSAQNFEGLNVCVPSCGYYLILVLVCVAFT